ncbi:unnamed protein product [Darwinula stevensoni]|uniref:START domain-containing protein n=1 Tax=Darwinula stevensoni TaxID=69355 RepID=A0A7R9FQJ1_9CRUS|nr:unnamed protein product [Darwinula stevensoni]CAG0899605.1 unnamed protein product [Darwinula stevensoni]
MVKVYGIEAPSLGTVQRWAAEFKRSGSLADDHAADDQRRSLVVLFASTNQEQVAAVEAIVERVFMQSAPYRVNKARDMASKLSREAVIYMFQQGHSPAKIIKELKLPRSTVYKAIVGYKELGTTQDRPRSGRPSVFKDPALRKRVKQLLDRNPERKCRSLAKHLKIKRETLRSYLRKKLGIFPFKKRIVQEAEYLEEGKSNTSAMKNMLTLAPWETLWIYSDEDISVKSFYDADIQRTSFLIETTLNIPPERALDEDWNGAGDYAKWNPNVAQSFIIQKISENCQIIRQITNPLVNGLIWSRDILLLCHWERDGEKIYSSAVSTTCQDVQASDDYVQATCYSGSGFAYSPAEEDGKTLFQWIYNTDMHLSFMPDALLNTLLPNGFREFIGYYRARFDKIVAHT